jgi:hypothetical protein
MCFFGDRLRLLAVRYRRVDADAQPELPGPIRGHCGGPREDHLSWQGQPRGIPVSAPLFLFLNHNLPSVPR